MYKDIPKTPKTPTSKNKSSAVPAKKGAAKDGPAEPAEVFGKKPTVMKKRNEEDNGHTIGMSARSTSRPANHRPY
jgi:hypothetical protein